MSQFHNAMLVPARIPMRPTHSWKLSDRVSFKDFDQMSAETRAIFKDQLLKTVLVSVKILTLNEPSCLAGSTFPNGGHEYFSKEFKSILQKPAPTTNGTFLLFRNTFVIVLDKKLPCNGQFLHYQ